jgi:hypothetical protein
MRTVWKLSQTKQREVPMQPIVIEIEGTWFEVTTRAEGDLDRKKIKLPTRSENIAALFSKKGIQWEDLLGRVCHLERTLPKEVQVERYVNRYGYGCYRGRLVQNRS